MVYFKIIVIIISPIGKSPKSIITISLDRWTNNRISFSIWVSGAMSRFSLTIQKLSTSVVFGLFSMYLRKNINSPINQMLSLKCSIFIWLTQCSCPKIEYQIQAASKHQHFAQNQTFSTVTHYYWHFAVHSSPNNGFQVKINVSSKHFECVALMTSKSDSILNNRWSAVCFQWKIQSKMANISVLTMLWVLLIQPPFVPIHFVNEAFQILPMF